MRITVNVDLQENEAHIANDVLDVFRGVSDSATSKVITDTAALTTFIREAILSGTCESIQTEISRRLSQSPLVDDCLEVILSILFDEDRPERSLRQQPFQESTIAYLTLLGSLSDSKSRNMVKDKIVKKSLNILSTPRRIDTTRRSLIPACEILAGLVALGEIPAAHVVSGMLLLVRSDATRCAAITCVGKLVEMAFEAVLDGCNDDIIGHLQTVILGSFQEDFFVYDVEYISEIFGWVPPSEKFMNIGRTASVSHHKSAILALAHGVRDSGRDIVVTSSEDGSFVTWDAHQGALVEKVSLARHYACTLDLTNQATTLLVGGNSRENGALPPAVVIYPLRGDQWSEQGAVEPKDGRTITCIKSVRGNSSLLFCAGVTMNDGNSVFGLYDGSSQRSTAIQEYPYQTDVITSICAPQERDNIVMSGSRDTTVVIYDLRTHASTGNGYRYTHHYSTVTGIGVSDNYLVTVGLDKRLVVCDLRNHQQLAQKELESSILSLAINSHGVYALATMTGLHMAHLQGSCFRVDVGRETPRYNSMAWSSQQDTLFCGGDNCNLDIISEK